MDYDIFDTLCKQHGTTPTALVLKLGLSKGNTTSWKNGGNPSVEILIKLSDELNCTSDLLLGKEPEKEKQHTIILKPDEIELLSYYNQLPVREQGQLVGELKATVTMRQAIADAEAGYRQDAAG